MKRKEEIKQKIGMQNPTTRTRNQNATCLQQYCVHCRRCRVLIKLLKRFDRKSECSSFKMHNFRFVLSPFRDQSCVVCGQAKSPARFVFVTIVKCE